MSDQSVSESGSARGSTSQDSGERFLDTQEGWEAEARAVIQEVEKFVKKIDIADKLQVI